MLKKIITTTAFVLAAASTQAQTLPGPGAPEGSPNVYYVLMVDTGHPGAERCHATVVADVAVPDYLKLEPAYRKYGPFVSESVARAELNRSGWWQDPVRYWTYWYAAVC